MPYPRFKIILFAFFIFGTLPLQAGVRSNFLSHGPSCVALSRGDTGVSLYAGPGSAFYNPALLSTVGYSEAELSHFSLFEGSRYNFGAFALPLSPTVRAGISVINLCSGEFELRRTLTDQPSTARASQWAMLFSAARHFHLLQGVDAGVSLKHLSFDMAGWSGNGTGMDAGVAADFNGPSILEGTSLIRAGLSVQNLVSPEITMISEREAYPLTVISGGSLSIPLRHRYEGKDTLDLFTEVSHADGAFTFHEGVEYSFAGRCSARAGMYGSHLTAGAGCRLSEFMIDYAIDFNDLSLFHRFSLRYRWQADPSKKNSKVRKGSLLYEARQAMTESAREKKEREKVSRPLFRQALKEYRRHRYLNASGLFGQLILKYPEVGSAHLYYQRINDEMSRDARSSYESNLENASYARGFVNYRDQRFSDALREWEKVLQIDPEQTELEAYMNEARARIKDQERIEKEKNDLAAAKELFEKGCGAFSAGNYISCIKTMEKLQLLCGSYTFPQAADFHSNARGFIDRSVKELTLLIKKQPARAKHAAAVSEKPPEVETDEQGSEKKYREGLILYAQGKPDGAERTWEIALRLNPGNEKARRALDKVRQETSSAR